MSFYAGIILGIAIGAIMLSIFYAWLLRQALKNKEETGNEFLDVQRKNGEHLREIADQLEFLNQNYSKK